MSLKWLVVLLFASIGVNVARFIYSKRHSSIRRHYTPDLGVNPKSQAAGRKIVDKFGVVATTKLHVKFEMHQEVLSFFSKYQCLRIDYVVHLNRIFLEQGSLPNSDFVKIGVMDEEDDLLVKQSRMDPKIYIVECEDGDPGKPEVLATNFENLMAIVGRNAEQLNSCCSVL